MLDPLVLIREYGPAVGLAIFFAIVVMMAVRSWMATNDKIRLQKSEMESIRLQITANENKHKIEMETAAAKQREEMEDESNKREQKLLREIRGLYEKRFNDQHEQIAALEAQRRSDKQELDEQKKLINKQSERIETLASDLGEQKLLLQAEKRAYAELETFNESLQRNNDNLTRQNADLMASEAKNKQTIEEMRGRLENLAQRISDLEQDIQHKNAQIVSLQNQVLGLKQVTVTGENPTINVAEPVTVATLPPPALPSTEPSAN